MQRTITFALILFAGTTSRGESHSSPAAAAGERSVTVCMEDGAGFDLGEAKVLASSMFAEIGVTVRWRPGIKRCPARGIMISLYQQTPRSFMPGSLAYAQPYEGTHIRVFYDRITSLFQRGVAGRVLAHVLVHEITHILQGIDRHSERGIMKALWDMDDFTTMRRKPLKFEPEDIDLIEHGLSDRAIMANHAASTVAANRSPT